MLNEVSFDVADGQVIALIGSSGAGKSTLLRCINGLEPFQAGTIRLNGRAVTGSHRHLRELRKEVGMVFQSFNLFPHMTAVRNVALAPTLVRRMPRREAEKAALSMLDRVGLAAKADSYPAQLSGGQQQRVAIARALAMNPTAMLFDEPTSALDPELVGEVQDAIASLAHDGMTMLIATHAMRFARSIAHQVVVMGDGAIIEAGPPEQVLVSPTHPRTQALLRTVLSGN